MGQTASISASLHQYILERGTSESSHAQKLRHATEQHEMMRMMSSPEQTQLLVLLLQLIAAKRVIEIGVYSGYSTLRMAEALPDIGEIFACDISEEWMQIGKPFWQEAQVNHKIIPVIAPALDTLQRFIDEGQAGLFDLIYIDADKSNNIAYYHLALQLIRSKGLIVIDNMFLGQRVLNLHDDSTETTAVRELAALIHADRSVTSVLLPVGDGISVMMKTS